jgi:hypothetical protein
MYLTLYDRIYLSFFPVVQGQKYIRIDYHRPKETNALSQCGLHQHLSLKLGMF